MPKLPILLSVPHAGIDVPVEARPFCRLSQAEVIHDGDEGASEIYALEEHVDAFLTTDVARAIIDLNREEDDRRKDGIVKTHTCWDVPVYDPALPDHVAEQLIARYHRPYHERLRNLTRGVKAAFDCHTMAAVGPPVGPDHGVTRPPVCLGDVDGGTFPGDWMAELKRCFERAFGLEIAVNQPFKGGFITRTHGRDSPWVQIELSRGDFMTNAEKRTAVLNALTAWCHAILG